VHACELLGALRCAEALPALRTLAKHADAAIAAAAQAAVARIEAKDAPAGR
jgi:hypothetical protein